MIESSFKFAGIAGAMAMAISASVVAQDAVQWRFEDGGNGHWYEFRMLPQECIELAEARVNGFGAHLATVRSDAENAFVDALIPNWNGVLSVAMLGAYQDDGAKSPEDGWHWINGEPWDYTAWSPHNDQPNDDAGSEESAVVMYSTQHTPFGSWHDSTPACLFTTDIAWIIEWSADCNEDGIVDYGQILDGTLSDDDGDGVPDICESTGLFDPKLTLANGYSIAIDAEGELIVWGGSGAILDVPEEIVDPVAVSAWSGHALVLQADGGVVAWGRNDYGQADVPDSLPPAVAIAALDAGSLAIHADGSATGWGRDFYCGAGTGSLDVPSGVDITEVSGGNAHWLYRKTDGTVAGRGCNFNGQWNVPASAQPPVDFEANESWSCVLAPDGTINAFGYGGFGRLNTPGGNDFIDIACGSYSGLGLRSDGTIVAWGDNSSGQGNVPATLENVIAVEAGIGFSAAIHEDGTLTMWGANAAGQSDRPADLRVRLYDADCDGDGVADWEAILRGIVEDVNQNGRPDGCDCLADTDGDGSPDCLDDCPNDPNKTEPGACGCGVEDTDSDGDGIADCNDPCPNWPYDCSEDGQTITVSEGQSIQSAIEVVPGGGTVLVESGTYYETIDVDGRTVTILGSGEPGSVVIDGEGMRRGVVVARGETAATRFENLVFRNGVNLMDVDIDGDGSLRWWEFQGAGGYVYESSPTFVSCRFESNVCTRSGGGMYVFGGSSNPEFIDCVFTENESEASGGGVSLYLSSAMFVDCDLLGNRSESATFGGAGMAVTGEGGGVSVTGGRFEANEATSGPGGAVSVSSVSTLVMSGVVAIENTSYAAAAVYGAAGSDFVLSDSQVCSNSGGQVSVEVQDAGGNCISEVCDSDADGTLDCDDGCPEDPSKTEPGACGCGVADTDTDGDGTPDCNDGCPDDSNKTEPGDCGCGVADTDTDGDGTPDCIDPCPSWPYDCSDDGQTIVVAPGQDLALAMSKVPDGGVLQLLPGTFNQIIDFAGRPITIQGDAADPSLVVLDGTGIVDSSVVVMINGEGPDSVLRGVTIRNGAGGTPLPVDGKTPNGGGAIFGWETSPTIEDCIIESNAAPLGGGAFFRAGAVVIRRCDFRSNNASSYGGGLNLSRCFGALVEDCRFTDNFTNASGAGCHAFGGDPMFVRCDFESNQSLQPGGAVSWDSGGQGPLLLDECVVQFNQSASEGGGIATLFGTVPGIWIRSSTICDNEPDNLFGGYVDLGDNTLCICPADLSGNGVVDGPDLGLWLAYAGKSCIPGEVCPGDLDGDGEITGGDLGVLLSAWGVCP
jgi:hypothetical protein